MDRRDKSGSPLYVKVSTDLKLDANSKGVSSGRGRAQALQCWENSSLNIAPRPALAEHAAVTLPTPSALGLFFWVLPWLPTTSFMSAQRQTL